MSKEESKPDTVSAMVEQLTTLGFVVLCPEDYTSNQVLESQLAKAKELLNNAKEILRINDYDGDADEIESFLKS